VTDQTTSQRRFVLVSGYYGFGNLGDEAILEELTNELKQLIAPTDIVVLSNNPQQTAKAFGVTAISRWQPLSLITYLFKSRLFVSGGGGLFQDSTGIKSVIFYGCQITLSRILSVPILIYAQGLGPLKGELARNITRLSMREASRATVRDGTSYKMLQEWHVEAELTADPVWNLAATALPYSIAQKLKEFKSDNFTVGLSLRNSDNFGDQHFAALVSALNENLPEKSSLLLLPLQAKQDKDLLLRFQRVWTELGRNSWLLETEDIQRPSQWLNILSQCDLVVGMRLHALILALSAGVPVVGLSYDAKVAHVLNQFEQPILNLTKESQPETVTNEWIATVRMAVATTQGLSEIAKGHAQGAKKLACQNFQLLDRLLNMQSDPSAGR